MGMIVGQMKRPVRPAASCTKNAGKKKQTNSFHTISKFTFITLETKKSLMEQTGILYCTRHGIVR
jgi:hypothetical protein